MHILMQNAVTKEALGIFIGLVHDGHPDLEEPNKISLVFPAASRAATARQGQRPLPRD